MNKYETKDEIAIALEKFLRGIITKKQYDNIVKVYKPIQD